MAAEAWKEELLAKLPELRAEYERLGKLIAAAEEFVGETVSVSSNGAIPERPRGPRPAIRPDEFTGMSTTKAIRAFLELMGRGSPQGPREMAKALVQGGRDKDEQKAYANVTSALKRMNKFGEIKQVRRGQWGLASWYGGTTTRKPQAKGNDESEKGAEGETEV